MNKSKGIWHECLNRTKDYSGPGLSALDIKELKQTFSKQTLEPVLIYKKIKPFKE